MKGLLFVIIAVVVLVAAAGGCVTKTQKQPVPQLTPSEETKHAAIEKAREQWKMTPEAAKLQAKNFRKLINAIEQYKEDIGAYPKSLEELKNAGYDFPEHPSPRWEWQYVLKKGVPMLCPIPEGLNPTPVPAEESQEETEKQQPETESTEEQDEPCGDEEPSEEDREAQIEKAKRRFTITAEEAKQQAQNQQKVLQALEKFKEDYGVYPQSLDELKNAGFNFPEEPSPGWAWLYALTDAGPVLQPVPKEFDPTPPPPIKSQEEAKSQVQETTPSEEADNITTAEPKKIWKLTAEDARLQEKNRQELINVLEQYKEDTGSYPESLGELKEAGYDYPEEPSPGWGWAYRVRPEDGVVQVMPVPESNSQ